MPLPAPAPRHKLHTRNIVIEGYGRDDGMWDIEGVLTDVKTFDFPNAIKHRPAGTFHHEIRVRITIDNALFVRAIEVASDTNPFDAHCTAPLPNYQQLVGTNLAKGFRKALQAVASDVKGCTHVNELLGVMPTGAFQSLAGRPGFQGTPEQFKMVLDQCAGWDTSQGHRAHFPVWLKQDRGEGSDAPT